MCGRYQLVVPADELAALFGIFEAPEPYMPRYNIAPTQPIHVVHLAPDGTRRADLMRWGLLPSWVKDPKAFPLIINGRSETAAQKPAFRNALRRRRVLVPASGFYEWAREGAQKQPYLFSPDKPIALAGVYETWMGPNGEEMDTVAVLTAEAVGVPAEYHDRMPLSVPTQNFSAWLDKANDNAADALELTERAAFEARPVSKRLSNARNEGPGLLDPDDDASKPPPKPAAKTPASGEDHRTDPQLKLL